VRRFTRRGFDWTQRYLWIVRSARQSGAFGSDLAEH
jgi:hypothetical protein